MVSDPPCRLMAFCGAPADELVAFVWGDGVTCRRCRTLAAQAQAAKERREAEERQRLKEEKDDRKWRRECAPKVWVARACGARLVDIAGYFGLPISVVSYLDGKIQAKIEQQWHRFAPTARRPASLAFVVCKACGAKRP